ncbi:glycosyltransferase BC10 [Mercurialis annua]|uniref:glycosyltransferase BC10 n=1 Tax=Mercurialis annua TaxID=3986 RepID=UPI00215F86FC|nr:glycosyltransferase BC10 [Mercurialis annua]
MFSPTPLSLFCALFLFLPLTFVVTNNITTTTTTAKTTAPISTITSRRSLETISLKKYHSTQNHHQKLLIKTVIPLTPPPPLPEDDRSLLKLAARVNPRPLLHPKKVAFLFLTTTPLQFAPLWELFFSQASKNLFNIYIHADPTRTYDPPFSGVFFNRVIPSKPTQRYSPTLISAARRLLAHALLHDPSNAMFAILSPSCIPLHSFKFTYETLIRSRKSFIEILKNEERTFERWAARGMDAMLPEVKLEDFRMGSQFWVLTRKHARIVVDEERIWLKFNQTCVERHACYPEENYFPTLIHMRDPRGTVSASLTHVDWEGSFDGHPRMYEADEVELELIMAMRNSRPRYGYDGINGSDLPVTKQNDPFLFARKFSPESIEGLMSIAKEAILKD